MSAMFRIVEDDRPPIPERCSPELSDFLCLCFNKDPRKRPTAEELFSHVWLQKNWDPQKVRRRPPAQARGWLMRFAWQDLRPQDSIPFLRRISSEMRRPEMDIYGSPIQERMSPSPADLSFYSSSPLSARSPLFPDLAKRGSSDSGYRLSTDYPSTPEPQVSYARVCPLPFESLISDYRSGRFRLRALLLSPTTATTANDRTRSSRPRLAKVRRCRYAKSEGAI